MVIVQGIGERQSGDGHPAQVGGGCVVARLPGDRSLQPEVMLPEMAKAGRFREEAETLGCLRGPGGVALGEQNPPQQAKAFRPDVHVVQLLGQVNGPADASLGRGGIVLKLKTGRLHQEKGVFFVLHRRPAGKVDPLGDPAPEFVDAAFLKAKAG